MKKLIMMGMLASLGPPALGASRTLDVKHPVLDHGIDKVTPADHERAVERIMSMSEERMLSFMPDKPFVRFCECPHCYGGVEGNHIFEWTIARPDEMKCKFCGTVFPNPKFPEDQVLTGKNLLGEEVSFSYHQSQTRDVRHFLSGNLMYWQRAWLVEQCIALGKAYQATGREAQARRVVLVLDRIARLYPHYPVMQNGPRRVTFRGSQEPPYEWDSGKWGCFHNEVPKRLVQAYDLVCESQEFDTLAAARGYDVRETFENDFLRETYKAIALSPYHVSNVVGYDIAGAATLGRVLNEPDYVHRAFGWMKRNVDEGFFRDGMWHEAPSYHYMTIGGLRSAFGRIRGYSDPPGYIDPIDGTRFDDFDPDTQVPFWTECLSAPSVLDFPNGCSTPVHDTWANERRSPPRQTTVSAITPAYGHASLGRGTGSNQMLAQLHFSGGYGHSHCDSLNLTLYAKGCEMLSDLGYTWTQMRYWCTSTVGHNTVVVDRRDQTAGKSDGNLLWFFPDSGGVGVVEADGRRAYRAIDGVDRYRRMLVLIPVSEADAYVVDVFRVRGGGMHDWALHGDADADMTASCTLPLSGPRKWMLEPGEEWQEPTIEGARFNAYGMLRDVQRGGAEGGACRVDFAYVEEPAKGLRVHTMPGGAADVWLGKSPSVRRMGKGTAGDMRKAYDFWMPQLLVRRRGEDGLSSVFVAVHEPHAGAPFISSVEHLPLVPPDPNACALRVSHGQRQDTIICTLDAPPYAESRTAGGITIRGRLGVVRHDSATGRSTGAWLFEGLELAGGGWQLTSGCSGYEGRIESVTRKADGAEHDAFVTTGELPLGGTLHGVWLLATHGGEYTQGYEIDRIETRDGKTRILLARDHGLRLDGDKTREVYFPRREFSGPNTFTIPLATCMRLE